MRLASKKESPARTVKVDPSASLGRRSPPNLNRRRGAGPAEVVSVGEHVDVDIAKPADARDRVVESWRLSVVGRLNRPLHQGALVRLGLALGAEEEWKLW